MQAAPRRLAELAAEDVKARGYWVRDAAGASPNTEARLQAQLRLTRQLKERRASAERWSAYQRNLRKEQQEMLQAASG